MRGTLRPVGEYLDSGGASPPLAETWPVPEGRERRLYRSGTAALAAACVACCKRAQRTAGVRPSILAPAYTCPDVVAAIVHADAEPVLVDLEAGSPRMDPDALRAELSGETAAIVAINFLGIPERLESIVEIARPSGVAVIHDACQAFPVADAVEAEPADFVVTSFGRGKPVSLLGGGALTFNPLSAMPARAAAVRLPGRWRELLYNLAIRPPAYGLVASIPQLGIGTTAYEPLSAIEELEEASATRLAAAIRRYRAGAGHRERIVRAYEQRFGPDLSLRAAADLEPSGDALRYPLLLPTAGERDAALAALGQAGLGASAFYADALPDIRGMPDAARANADVPAARDFASRLLTLPVHADVDGAAIDAIAAIVSGSLGMASE